MQAKLTKQQQKVLDFISRHIEEKGYAPTNREVMLAMGYQSPSDPHRIIKVLEEKGYLKRGEPGSPRAVTVVGEKAARPAALDTFMRMLMKGARRNSLMELLEEWSIAESEYEEIKQWFESELQVKL